VLVCGAAGVALKREKDKSELILKVPFLLHPFCRVLWK
jgi:hypothetical protein